MGIPPDAEDLARICCVAAVRLRRPTREIFRKAVELNNMISYDNIYYDDSKKNKDSPLIRMVPWMNKSVYVVLQVGLSLVLLLMLRVVFCFVDFIILHLKGEGSDERGTPIAYIAPLQLKYSDYANNKQLLNTKKSSTYVCQSQITQ